MKTLKSIVLIRFIFFSCFFSLHYLAKSQEKVLKSNTMDELILKDKQFSEASQKYGKNKAFLMYCHDEATMLVKEHYPIVGKENISKYLHSKEDSGYELRWEPLFADVSESKDLAYTYGIWTFTPTNGENISQGTYCTIWKCDSKGDWKWILDSGNEGLHK